MSNPFSVRDPSISHTKVENALLPKEGDDGSNFVLYVDNVNKRLGINNANPEQAIDCAGYIQLRSTPVQRLILWDDADDHINADIGGAVDGTDGGVLGFITKEDGGLATEKLRINNIGAIGIGGANYGTQGQVLVSNGPGSSVSWGNSTPYYLNLGFNVVGGVTTEPYSSNSNFYPTDDFVINTNRYATQYPTSDFPTTGTNSGYWTPSETGLYLVNVRLTLWNTSDEIWEYSVRLVRHDIGGSEEEWARTIFRSDTGEEDFRYLPVTFSTLVKVDTVGASGERYRLKATVNVTNFTDVLLFKSIETTCMEITKIA
jgi:hypothetical protein